MKEKYCCYLSQRDFPCDCENQKAERVSDSSPVAGSAKVLVSEQTFRSTPMVNKTDDMVRVTIDMKRTVWFGWKKVLIQKGMKPNADLSVRERSER